MVILKPEYFGCYFSTLVGWLVLWSPGAAGAFLWRPPGCPYSGRPGRGPGAGRGGSRVPPRGWIIEKSGRVGTLPSPNHQPLPLQPGACYIRCSGGQTFPWVFARLMNKWSQMVAPSTRIGATHSRILLVYSRSTRPRHHYRPKHKTQMQLIRKYCFTQKKSLAIIKSSTWIICGTCNWQNFWPKSNKTPAQMCWVFLYWPLLQVLYRVEKMFKKKTVLNFLLSDSHPNINHVLVKVLWKSRVFLTIINGGLDA